MWALLHYFFLELVREPEWEDPDDDLRRLSGDRDLDRLFLRSPDEEDLERLRFLLLSGEDDERELE